jgi:hypothetical protein
MQRLLVLTGAIVLLVLVGVPGTAAAQGGGAAPAAQAPPPPPPPAVKVGEPMPEFTLSYLEPGPDGGRPTNKTAKLSDFKGKQVVVLAFYPAAFSPG